MAVSADTAQSIRSSAGERYKYGFVTEIESETAPRGLDEDIVRRALAWPARLIAENAGIDGAIVVGKLLESKNSNWGYDAQNGEYTDMVKAGIIDPTKVVRCALQDAASVAGLLVTTEAMVAEKPEKKKASAAPGSGMGEDMDY